MKLIGPFPATTKPVRDGVYKVSTPNSRGNRFAYWDKKHGWRLSGATVLRAAKEKVHTDDEPFSLMSLTRSVWWGISA